MTNESIPSLPACRHRGVMFAPGRWYCGSRRLFIPGRWVSAVECGTLCRYVDQPDVSQKELQTLLEQIGPDVVRPIFVRPRPEELAIAIISAPRTERTVDQSIAQLRYGGFQQEIHVFEEPGTQVREFDKVLVHTNERRLGLWPNWRQAAQHLLVATRCSHLLICEDDIALNPVAMLGLQHAIDTLPHATWGVASLFTSHHHLSGMPIREGWQALVHGEHWGSQTYCFPRPMLAAVLQSATIREYEGNDFTDIVVRDALRELGLTTYHHLPSLADHTGGAVSSVHHGDLHHVRGWGFTQSYAGYAEC